MATSAALLSPRGVAERPGFSLLVTARDPQTRHYRAAGVLSRTETGTFHFRYLSDTGELTGILPFLGFENLEAEYWSPRLFPLFAERLIDDARPDRLTLFEALALMDTAEPMEFLARSGGRRGGDTIELLPIPDVRDGRTSCTFLVHGVRHQEGAAAAIDALVAGQLLNLQEEPDNAFDSRAVLVTTDGTRLGWVPSPLLEYVHAVMAAGDFQLSVVRANGPEFGHHMRLLVELEGAVPDGYQLPW